MMLQVINCIYCHNELLSYNTYIVCKHCITGYDIINNTISCVYLFRDEADYRYAEIDIYSSTITIYQGLTLITVLPIRWVFPSTLDDLLNRIESIKAFI